MATKYVVDIKVEYARQAYHIVNLTNAYQSINTFTNATMLPMSD